MSVDIKTLKMKRNKKLDKVYLSDYQLVVNSQEDRTVIGRIENDAFIPLDEKALEMCKKYGFPYQGEEKEKEKDEDQEEEEEDQEDEDEEDEDEKVVLKKQESTKNEVKNKEENKSKNLLDKLKSLLPELENLLLNNNSSNDLKDKLVSLEKENEDLKKQLAETKKKLKSVLETFSSDLN
jgi:hypothetical protein